MNTRTPLRDLMTTDLTVLQLDTPFRRIKSTAGKTYSKKTYNNIFAKDIMTENPVFLNPEDSIGLAADLFLENIYHAIPIMEDGVLVGIITTHDLLAYAFYKAPVGKEE